MRNRFKPVLSTPRPTVRQSSSSAAASSEGNVNNINTPQEESARKPAGGMLACDSFLLTTFMFRFLEKCR